MQTKEFWQSISILAVEKIRTDIRELMKFLIDDGIGRLIVYSSLDDQIGEIAQTDILHTSKLYIKSYRRKIVHYLEENKTNVVIFKLRNNLPITVGELAELEQMLLEQGDINSQDLLSQVYKFHPPLIEIDAQSIFGLFNGDEPDRIINLIEQINHNADAA